MRYANYYLIMIQSFKCKETEKIFGRIFSKKFPCWLIYRNLFFDEISKKLIFDVFKSFRDRQITKKNTKKTGKIRNIYCDDKHILSMRAGDGMFTLKIKGAKMLHNFFKYPKFRVTVQEEAVPFVKDGKSVFAKFVIDCDKELRPYDECLIVNKNDDLLATGRCLLNKLEMSSFNFGMAVKTREHID